LLEAQLPFVVAYADLDNFKPFNDLYGYAAGDEMICLLARLLVDCVDGDRDFVGHVGGDDFALLLQSPDWRPRLEQMLQQLTRQSEGCLIPHTWPVVALTCRDVMVQMHFPRHPCRLGWSRWPGQFPSHYEVGPADAKKQAKKQPGSSLFVERRLSHPAGGLVR
jgi:GGDEF domain-containing protein